METAENSIGIPDQDDAYKYKIRMNISRLTDEINGLKNIENEIARRSTDNEDITNLRALEL